jgi:DNA-binding transcriptional LysR family regulator
LTAAGKVFLKYVEETLEARRQIVAAMAEMERVPRGELVVAANEGTWLHILPEVFAEFKRLYPDVAVSVKRSESPKILESIIDNSIDFGVVSMPVNDKRLTTVVIHRDELVVIAPPRHPLAKCKSVTLAQVAEYPLLLPEHGRSRDLIETLFGERGLKFDCSMELDSSELTKRFVAANVGIAFIAYSHIEREVRSGLLAACKPSDAQMARDLALVFRKDKALSRAALAFIEIAVKHKVPETISVLR